MSDVDVLGRIEADVEDGGWRISGQVFGDADKLDFYKGLDAWFDLYIGGGWEAQPRPGLSGHLLPEAWQKTFQTSVAPFSGFTAHQIMKSGRVQGIFFRHVASSPANDHQIIDQTYADIVEHVLGISGQYGHCNLVQGVWPEGFMQLNIDSANSSAIDEYEMKDGNFWSRLKEIANIDLYYLFVDKRNLLNFTRHPMFGGSLPASVLTLDDELLLQPLDITTRNAERVGQIKLQGATPSGTQITGIYPTDPTAGPVEIRGGYIASSDAEMDAVAERMYRFENRSHTVTARIGNGLGLLLELLDRLSITYSSAADGISWTTKKFWVHKILVEILANFNARTTLVLEAEN